MAVDDNQVVVAGIEITFQQLVTAVPVEVPGTDDIDSGGVLSTGRVEQFLAGLHPGAVHEPEPTLHGVVVEGEDVGVAVAIEITDGFNQFALVEHEWNDRVGFEHRAVHEPDAIAAGHGIERWADSLVSGPGAAFTADIPLDAGAGRLECEAGTETVEAEPGKRRGAGRRGQDQCRPVKHGICRVVEQGDFDVAIELRHHVAQGIEDRHLDRRHGLAERSVDGRRGET